MRVRIASRITLVLIAMLMIGLCFVEADAQQRRRRRPSRRVTNPVASSTTPTTPPPTTTTTTTTSTTSTADPRIISTSNDEATSQDSDQTSTRRTRRTRSAATDDPDSMRRTVENLSTKVTQLTDEIGEMKREQRTLVEFERLSRAEQRAEALHKQLLDVTTKQADLEARRDQIDSDLRPENIERSVAS